MTNSVFREVWLWHSRSKTRTKTGKIGLKFGKFAFFCGYITKLFTNFVKYKRSNKIWKSIKLWKSLFYNSVSAFWFILKKIYWAERSIAFFFFDFLGELDFALLLFCDFSGKCSQECETIKSMIGEDDILKTLTRNELRIVSFWLIKTRHFSIHEKFVVQSPCFDKNLVTNWNSGILIKETQCKIYKWSQSGFGAITLWKFYPEYERFSD